jgi:hypothetical protein
MVSPHFHLETSFELHIYMTEGAGWKLTTGFPVTTAGE